MVKPCLYKAQAREAGLSRYFTGNPCKKGHTAERRTSDGGCVACSRLKSAAQAKKWPEKAKRYAKVSYLRHRTKQSARVKVLYRKDPAPWLFRNARRRAISKSVPFHITLEYVRSIWPKDNKCPVLGIEFCVGDHARASAAIDRRIPDRGYVPGNVEIICCLANRLKSDVTDPLVFESIARWLRLRQ